MKELFELVLKSPAAQVAALTVQQQARLADNLPELRWSTFFPRHDATSIQLANLTMPDFRPVADRRPWNGRGRLVPMKTPTLSTLVMAPIEAYFSYSELDLQRLAEPYSGNFALMVEALGLSLPDRAAALADADYRRIEIDAFEGWRRGQVVAMDPESGGTLTLSLGIDAGRYITPGTAWTGSTAYNEFVRHSLDAANTLGAIEGALLRRSTFNAIQASAPVAPLSGYRPTKTDIEKRIQDEIGTNFAFRIEERTLDVFTGKGTTTAGVKVWNGTEVAFIPSGITVGKTEFAPVVRAQMVAKQLPQTKIDVRGVAVFMLSRNDDKNIEMQAQLNALPVPNANKVYVVNGGI